MVHPHATWQVYPSLRFPPAEVSSPTWEESTLTSDPSSYWSPQVGRKELLTKIKAEAEAKHVEFLRQMAIHDGQSLGSRLNSPSTRQPTTTGTYSRSSSSWQPTTTGNSGLTSSSSFRPRTTTRKNTHSGVPTPSTPSRSTSVTFGNICRTPPLCDMSFADTIPSELALTPSHIVTDYGSPSVRPVPDAHYDYDALDAQFADALRLCAESKAAADELKAKLAALGSEPSTTGSYVPSSGSIPLIEDMSSSDLLDSHTESSIRSQDADWVIFDNFNSGFFLQRQLCQIEQQWGRLPSTISLLELACQGAALDILRQHSLSYYEAFVSSPRYCGEPSAFKALLPLALEHKDSITEAPAPSLPLTSELQNSSSEASNHSAPEVDLGAVVRCHMRRYSARSEPQFSHYSAATPIKPKTSRTWRVALGGVAVVLAGICAVAARRWF
ncbi:hypothetical protein E8E14_009528 [Neopestalotiopsis sp. 37M]|nr:hypothetical protein E8E14_009528 [Neopestalotiopsis sp. 37M]